VELVAVLVIVGVLAAIAQQAYIDLRYDARRATLEKIRAALVANLNAARLAYMTSGMTPGPDGPHGPVGTVQVAGRSVEVNGEGANVYGLVPPAGSPTAVGMWNLMDCGPLPVDGFIARCESIPRLEAAMDGDMQQVTFYIRAYCYVTYRASHARRGARGREDPPDFILDGQGTQLVVVRATNANPAYAAGAC
jgi:hypothetical protein